MKTLVLKEAQMLYNVFDASQLAQEPIMIERDGHPIGVLLPMAEYEAFHAWREAQPRQPIRDETLRREAEALERMKPELLRQYPGHVVALYNGQVTVTSPPCSVSRCRCGTSDSLSPSA
jgi:PHD/YefM family antitoxin component YafN of YafNO toxin-antitoxin module